MTTATNLNLTLITGASDGIGKAFAKQFAEQGHDLVLVARSEERLQALAKELSHEYSIQAHAYAIDLTEKDAAAKLHQQLKDDNLEVEILMNNAGLMYVDEFIGADEDKIEQLLTLNINAVVRMTRKFLPDMVARDRGKIVNVASVASFIPTPKFAIYGASKAFVLSFTEALSEEVKYSNVQTHTICPGFTDTKMINQGNGMEKIIPQFMKVTPESLVKDAYQAILKGETVFVHKLHNKAMVQWSRLYPKWVVRGVSGFFSRFKN